ncbi:DhNV_097 [Dikerogammarus haemobaphes nudivirus]|nr:DhNV_097 [Dikerogammarus haemobaphes nudivirus]
MPRRELDARFKTIYYNIRKSTSWNNPKDVHLLLLSTFWCDILTDVSSHRMVVEGVTDEFICKIPKTIINNNNVDILPWFELTDRENNLMGNLLSLVAILPLYNSSDTYNNTVNYTKAFHRIAKYFNKPIQNIKGYRIEQFPAIEPIVLEKLKKYNSRIREFNKITQISYDNQAMNIFDVTVSEDDYSLNGLTFSVRKYFIQTLMGDALNKSLQKEFKQQIVHITKEITLILEEGCSLTLYLNQCDHFCEELIINIFSKINTLYNEEDD